MNNYDGEWSDNVSTAYNKVSSKINELESLSEDYTNLADNLTKLKETCKEVDQAVKSDVLDLTATFKEDHHIRNCVIENTVYSVFTNWGNSSSGTRYINDSLDVISGETDSFFDSLEQWYDYEGGKEAMVNVLVAVLEIAGAALSVIAAIGAFLAGGSVVVLIAGIVGGCIAFMNGAANLGYEIEAALQAKDDPALAYRYRETNSLQDAFRTFTDDEFLHNFATVLDVTVFVCNAIDLFDSLPKFAKNGYKWLTGDTRTLKEIKIKDLFSGDMWAGINDKKGDFLKKFTELQTAIKNKDYIELGQNIKLFTSDSLYNLQNYYLEFHDRKVALSSTQHIVSAAKDILKNGWEGLGKSIVLPGISEELMTTKIDVNNIVTEYSLSDFSLKNIVSIKTKIGNFFGEEGLNGLYEKLQTPTKYRVSVSANLNFPALYLN